MRTKKDLHRLVDELPKSEIAAAGRYLEYLRCLEDPLLRQLLEAPEDDKALSSATAPLLAEQSRNLGQ